MVYSSAVYNYGNSYNPTYGVFTAPVRGLYAFTSTIRINGQGPGSGWGQGTIVACSNNNCKIVAMVEFTGLRGGSRVDGHYPMSGTILLEASDVVFNNCNFDAGFFGTGASVTIDGNDHFDGVLLKAM
jgi:hypothetical protein